MILYEIHEQKIEHSIVCSIFLHPNVSDEHCTPLILGSFTISVKMPGETQRVYIYRK